MLVTRIETVIPSTSSRLLRTLKYPIWIEEVQGDGGESSFRIGKQENQLLELQGRYVQRMFKLLQENQQGKLPAYSVNCHGAVDYIFGEVKPEWVDVPKNRHAKEMTVEKALERFKLPCGFQLVNDKLPWQHIHSAILLGSSYGAPIAFHKPGSDPFEICEFNDVLRRYPRYRRILFFGDEKESAVKEGHSLSWSSSLARTLASVTRLRYRRQIA